jgi:hypothetical protein
MKIPTISEMYNKTDPIYLDGVTVGIKVGFVIGGIVGFLIGLITITKV